MEVISRPSSRYGGKRDAHEEECLISIDRTHTLSPCHLGCCYRCHSWPLLYVVIIVVGHSLAGSAVIAVVVLLVTVGGTHVPFCNFAAVVVAVMMIVMIEYGHDDCGDVIDIS